MAEGESTHEVAEKTEKGFRAERETTDRSTDPSGGTTTRTVTEKVVETEGEPEQVKPDGR